MTPIKKTKKIFKKNSTKEFAHSPTLNTIKMVEHTIKNSPESATKISLLKKMLQNKVNHNTLMIVLEYLEEEGKIFIGLKGITWVKNDSKKMRKALQNSYEYIDGKFYPYKLRKKQE